MSVLVNFAIFPTDSGTSVSNEVSEVIQTVSESGYPYKLNAMGTVFETEEMEQALELIQKAYAVLQNHKRIYLVATMDIQHGKSNRISSKIKSVEDKLGKTVS